MALFALDVHLVEIPSTPLQLLVSLLLLTVIASAVILLVTQVGTRWVDKRWPATEPLDPTEMLWGESGGYIRRHFPGLDVEKIGRAHV